MNLCGLPGDQVLHHLPTNGIRNRDGIVFDLTKPGPQRRPPILPIDFTTQLNGNLLNPTLHFLLNSHP
jgi:hypothetical protein